MNMAAGVQQVQPPQPPAWKAALSMMMNPGEVVKRQMAAVPWPVSLSISGTAFTLFFLQTGIDMMRSGQLEVSAVALMAFLGILYGTLGIAAIAVLTWVLTKAAGNTYTLGWTVSTFALGYSATLVYAVIGLICSLAFGWKTAVAFGVTGVLWALRPTIFTIRQMTSDKAGLSVAIATLCGAILLFGWAMLGRFGF